ncbi:natterin-3-like isoform X2 [Parambassis ranga]|uniref:Natterin-3-like isoform X2 n=1 Tax=Parambassis ranga TaxID=210632 RepID=A0A6P7J140_9TELE|nr:natterin-3-like isoform X2 [Parambassis ranga]
MMVSDFHCALSVLLLLLLSSVSLQDTDEDSQHTNVSSRNAVLEDVPANRSGLTHRRLPVQLRQKRQTSGSNSDSSCLCCCCCFCPQSVCRTLTRTHSTLKSMVPCGYGSTRERPTDNVMIMLTAVSSMNAVLEDVPANRSGLTDQRLPARLRQKRQMSGGYDWYDWYDNGNLKWESWSDPLPAGAVTIYNKYARRYDYVCKNGCHSGFYNPSQGSYCQSPIGDDDSCFGIFKVLVNENDFEILEWKDGSSGSVPKNSVRTCPESEIYVGKNKYGLGKMDPRTDDMTYIGYYHFFYDAFWYKSFQPQVFHLYCNRHEYKFSSYQVLTINREVKNHQVSDVHYNTDEAVITKQPPETMRISVVRNAGCNKVVKTVTLEKEIQQERRWDISFSISRGVTTTLSAGVPGLVSGGLEISSALSFTSSSSFSGGHTVTERTSHSVSVELTAPPNHICRVKMLGYKYTVDIPFTARLQRTYTSGDIRATNISGTYKGVQTGEVWADVGRCQPIPNAESCP